MEYISGSFDITVNIIKYQIHVTSASNSVKREKTSPSNEFVIWISILDAGEGTNSTVELHVALHCD